MEIKIKKLNPNAVIPTYARKGDACVDLTAVSMDYDKVKGFVYGTGIAIELPEGYEALVCTRSSVCKTGAFMPNSPGIIDSGYRGEITAAFKNINPDDKEPPYKVGERIAQLKIQKVILIEFVEVEELSKSERGTGGYGSTGK